MRFNYHPEIEGKHAFLSPSKYAWIRYSPEKLLERFDTAMNAQLGTELHELAAKLIKLGIKLENTGQTLNRYVNDCIGYRMHPEVPLVVSRNAFGTADAIKFEVIDDRKILRIFDLKNGETPTKEDQLEIYAAFFCLEYKLKPLELEYDLRIYQSDDTRMLETDPEDILQIMAITVEYDKIIEKKREEA